MTDADHRVAIEHHWAASQAGDDAAEHAIYADDAVLEYPQSGERFRGRRNIQGQRGYHPARREFVVRRVRGSGELWTPSLSVPLLIELATGWMAPSPCRWACGGA